MQQAVSPHPQAHHAKSPASAGRTLIDSIREDKSLPALGSAVSHVVRAASSGDEAVGELARFILSDVALTQRILRLANTVGHRGALSAPVTTVSRAIFLLGFDMILSSAAAMLLVERLSDRGHASAVRQELADSLYASAIARGMARRAYFKDAEEAAVAALFTNVGRVLVAAYDHASYQDIAVLKERQGLSDSQASLQCIGCSFDNLAATVLREWQIPESTIGAALAGMPGKPKPPRTRQDWLQCAVRFSAEVSSVAALGGDEQDKRQAQLLERFGEALNIDAEQLTELMEKAKEETRLLLSQIDPCDRAADPTPGETPRSNADALSGMMLADDASGVRDVASRFPSGKPTNAASLLLASVQDITQMMASGRAKANDLMLIVLETLCHSMGFRFAAACLLDVQSGTYRARLAIGEEHAAKRSGMVFAAAGAQDLFHLSLENDADLLIADATEEKIRKLLPSWHGKTFADAKSFIVLPLVVQRRKIGFFYADRAQCALEGVSGEETALIKTLKSQVLMALQSR